MTRKSANRRIWSGAALLLLGVGVLGILRLIGSDEISHQTAVAETKDSEGCQCSESKLSANTSRTRAFAADAAKLVADLEAEVRRLKALPAATSSGRPPEPRTGDLLKRLEAANVECGRRPLTEQEAITDEAKQWRGTCSELAQASQEYGRPIEIYLKATERDAADQR